VATMTSHTFGPNLSIADFSLMWDPSGFPTIRPIARIEVESPGGEEVESEEA
jgi:hypothetical protein